MMKDTYKIGGKVIEIESIYEEVHRLCRDYRYCGDINFSVKTSQSDIDFEREKSVSEDIKEGIPVRNFPDSYLETLAVYRQIAEHMIELDTILFHGSAVAVDGAGYLFTAKSGTGKSTHTRLWREYFGERAVMVNDDKPLLQITENGVFVYGTAWDGKHHLSSNISVPLKAICILGRAEKNHIERIKKSIAFPMLLQQAYRSENTEKMKKILKIINGISDNVSLYKAGFNMEIESAEIAYNMMKG
ncbi:MAG: hypothetical protein NC040_06545 [Muribaculaceae bacterium]|nr:hypothetical protein [Alistipes senegalensis]MCM1473698.1 hypothetical protein [Muribaculaceae bacterium]